MFSTRTPILIVGAGISGLTLAQALCKEEIPFQIVEQDSSSSSRSAGWGLTIHWALPTFLDLLPQEVQARIPETYVNQEAVNKGEIGNFAFYDLGSGEVRWKVPPNKRIRVSRERLRQLLLTGIDVKVDIGSATVFKGAFHIQQKYLGPAVRRFADLFINHQWSKRLTTLHVSGDSATAHFDDGTFCHADIVVGCDGIHSSVRKMCFPSRHRNYELPVRMLGVGVPYSTDQVAEIRKLDPFFLHGSDSRSDVYLWFSFLEVPPADAHATKPYICQILVSWPYRSGFLNAPLPLEVPSEKSERLALMKKLSAPWAEPFRSIVQAIPSDAEAVSVYLQDWVPQRGGYGAGKAALIGDAAHAMVMFRGEGANQAITDISNFLHQLLSHLRRFKNPSHTTSTADQLKAVQDAVLAYEDEMCTRCTPSVLASRQACLDAHQHERINETSPLNARRTMAKQHTTENAL